MASLKDVKNRIASVKNTAKITNAMKLVSAAKFARASHGVNAARPFSSGYQDVVKKVLSSETDYNGPLVEQRPEKKTLIAVVSTDRGLCGGLNSNLFRFLEPKVNELKASGVEVTLVPWGRKAADFARKSGCTTMHRREKMTDKPDYNKARDLAQILIDSFCSGDYDSVYVAYPEFQSALAQEPKLTKVLPLSIASGTEGEEAISLPEIYPNTPDMVHRLLLKQLNVFMLLVLLDTTASEHGSRMSAMESATRNAKEVQKKLTVQYNRARQASITTELIEITSGAAAL